MVFQNNPLSGAVILVGIFYNSWIYGFVCLFGTIISTLTALWLKADTIHAGTAGLRFPPEYELGEIRSELIGIHVKDSECINPI